MFVLSSIGVINVSFSEILYFLLITLGIGLVYIGIDGKISVIIFFGTVMFLLGVLLLTNLNFNVKIENVGYVSITLLIATAGFLMIYIGNPIKKRNLIFSFVLFTLASILIFTKTRFEFNAFLQSIIPLLNIYWPAIVIFILLVILLRKQ
jgi:hypothetical protein